MISIVIPVYNGEKHIPNMLGCLRAQTASFSSFEVVFVNDGSSDGSSGLLVRAQQERFRVRVIDQPNAGVSAARNAGLLAAQGAYIAFADVDDLLAPNYIERLCAYAAHGADAVRFGFTRVDASAAVIAPAAQTPPVPADQDALLLAFLRDPKLFGPYGFLFRRAFLQENGLRFASGRAYYEDYDFLVRALALGKALLHTDAVLYAYRQAAGSAMMRYSAQRVFCLDLADSLCAFLQQQGCAAAGSFAKWYRARLYWAALWQACLALPGPADVRRFWKLTGGAAQLRRLTDYPDAKVRATALVGRVSPELFALLARALGRRRSMLSGMSRAQTDALLSSLQAEAPRRDLPA